MDTNAPRWFKSSHSAAETCCVEVAVGARAVRVRDSAHPEGRVLGLAVPEWAVLVRSVSGAREGGLRAAPSPNRPLPPPRCAA
ncbi:DUF397 domain-containing protein [Nocardiopsis sp. NPDC058631]|uniref:DUF397 domain-containing protein n=1 Tax=Nocardiopsis sp. NPDC058631 TaxID=3346566 RepID=UPI00364D75AB